VVAKVALTFKLEGDVLKAEAQLSSF